MRRRRHGSRWRKSSAGSGSVNLISMMDILTVLLLFLLKSYVAGGEVMVPPTGIHLPSSSADAPPQTSLVVAIDDHEILIGGERVTTLAEAEGEPGLEITPLSAPCTSAVARFPRTVARVTSRKRSTKRASC